MLIIASENDKTEGMDYYSAAIEVDFEGWKKHEFGIPDDLGRSRGPLGFDKIGGFRFTASGWGNTPDPNTTVIVDDIKLTWEAARLGPRMTDEGFFEALNLDYPGLEKTKQAVEAGDLQAAKAAFVKHIKSREKPKYFLDWRETPSPEKRPAKPNTRGADQALEHVYTITSVPLQFQDKIDWRANPTEPFDPEWTWQFGRHHWWPALGKAYWETGDEKYAEEFVWELRSWVRDNPMPRRVSNSVGSRWRTIECGIRLAGSWQRAFAYFLSSPSFTDEDVVMMIKSMAEQAEYLHKYPMSGNWLTMEANGMGHVGVLFPEFKRARAWREDAIERLHVELDKQVYPDGAQIELSTGYHYVSLGNFLGLARICMFNDVPLPDDYIAKLERMWAYGMWAMMPDRGLPPVNDAWGANVPRTLEQALEYFPEREDFRWIATDGREGAPPDHLSHFFPWAGWGIMRSGWGREDNYLFFDVGPFGYGHQHEDKLAFQIAAYGKRLLIDVGSYRYDTSKMRRYVVGPYAHNIVFVDGKPQKRRGLRDTYVNKEPQTNPWHTTEALDYCEGIYDNGFGNKNELKVTHKRQILFVKPEYWVVLDTLTPEDEAEHEYAALFHLGTEEAEAKDASVRTLGDEANLHIHAIGGGEVRAEIVKGQEEPYYLGWIGTHGVGNRRPIPVARFTWKASGESKLLYVFYPTRPGESPPSFAAHTGGLSQPQPLCAQLDFADGRQDVIRITVGEDGRETWRVDRLRAPGGDVEATIKLVR